MPLDLADDDDEFVVTRNVTFAWTSPYGGTFATRARECPDVDRAVAMLEELTGSPVAAR